MTHAILKLSTPSHGYWEEPVSCICSHGYLMTVQSLNFRTRLSISHNSVEHLHKDQWYNCLMMNSQYLPLRVLSADLPLLQMMST